MDNSLEPLEYLRRTKSAGRGLFELRVDYSRVLRDAPSPPVFFGFGDLTSPDNQSALREWMERTKKTRTGRTRAVQEYASETAALAVICGAILQLAFSGIRLCVPRRDLSVPEWLQPHRKTVESFCVGREVRGVPIGLLVYAGRNQDAHLGERLHELSWRILHRLGSYHTRELDPAYCDPAFDPRGKPRWSIAHNILAIIGWNDYEAYEQDMNDMLGPTPQRT